ncbi:GLE1-domain-containing protein [Coniochaeta ligniaria NRRL 30616]|uniref:mRNA export factor GLE1 n=1 Tax=Coniochaeta ligniaria NRRL 30616 TaxID=1408157 RepID=A0A1J7JRG3_9PEZI|nr:GLE1-domain-containing protein [Coniochaeta ligniaria NRRL 30616]
MAGSSPARRSYNHAPSSPLSDILYGERNSEARHKQLLEAAKREHERVRKVALRALDDHQKALEEHQREEERRHILEQERREEERIRQERELAAERKRLHELQAQKVEIPPEPQPKPEPSKTAASQASTAPSTEPTPAASSNPFARSATSSQTSQQQQAVPPVQNTRSSGLGTQTTTQQHTASPFGQPNPQQNGRATSQATTSATPQVNQALPDRYEAIHANLKNLRRSMMQQAQHNPRLKERMGDMRREIRKCVGQLTHGVAAANRKQLNAISTVLRESLDGQVQSQMVDPSNLVLEPRQPVEGAAHNAELPSLFVYLLNIFAKAAISQFINEASAKPETADPVGVTVAAVFSQVEFLWRDKSLIDILLAKFRVVCPVVFGHFGNEKYEDGRRKLGWHKENGTWVSEQQHFDRMTGLGAGFAAISLRNFSKSTKKNPFPPSNYWTAMARIVNTPPANISNTQAIVLKAMIEHYEGKFLDAYGNAGLAALRLALVDFPVKCPTRTPATESLQVHAQLLKKETGLNLQ